MAYLIKTQRAVSELYSARQFGLGTHSTALPRTGNRGLVIGERMIDPSDDPSKIKTGFSFGKKITGIPHVNVLLPDRPMDIQVILDATPSQDDPRIEKTKRELAKNLHRVLIDAGPDMTDRVSEVVIADKSLAETRRYRHEVKIIEARKDPEEISGEISKLCTNGLTFVISSFENLRLDQHPSSSFTETIGIKANHISTVHLDANDPDRPLEIPVGKGRFLDPSNDADVNTWNTVLDTHNQVVVDRLENVGIAVASIVLDPRLSYGFDLDSTDTNIARAVKTVS